MDYPFLFIGFLPIFFFDLKHGPFSLLFQSEPAVFAGPHCKYNRAHPISQIQDLRCLVMYSMLRLSALKDWVPNQTFNQATVRHMTLWEGEITPKQSTWGGWRLITQRSCYCPMVLVLAIEADWCGAMTWLSSVLVTHCDTRMGACQCDQRNQSQPTFSRPSSTLLLVGQEVVAVTSTPTCGCICGQGGSLVLGG